MLFKQSKIFELISLSSKLTRTTVLKDVVKNPNHLIEGIKEATQNAKENHNSDLPLFNFFSNKERVEKINKRLLREEIDFDNLFMSLSNISNYERFCLILNHIECYCDKLNQTIFDEFTKHLIESLGEPIGGLDYYAFVGKNDLSPPGVHVDHDHTFIFHLGPNNKTFLIWEDYFKDEELKTYNMVSEEKIESLKKYAREIILEPNDLLFIPKDVPHYAIYEDNSLMFGITLFPYYTDYIWFYNETQHSNLKGKNFLNSHDIQMKENLYLKYPKYKAKQSLQKLDLVKIPSPLSMMFATKPLEEDIRYNKGEAKKTLKPIYKTLIINEKK